MSVVDTEFCASCIDWEILSVGLNTEHRSSLPNIRETRFLLNVQVANNGPVASEGTVTATRFDVSGGDFRPSLSLEPTLPVPVSLAAGETQTITFVTNWAEGLFSTDTIFWEFEVSDESMLDSGIILMESGQISGNPGLWTHSPVPPDLVDLSGTIKTGDGADICAMVLASGQFTFSCNPPGVFSLTGRPQENDGTVKRQIYADGFFPKIDTLTGTTEEAVVMTRSGACPSYNTPYTPGVFPDSARERINISGTILLQDTQTPICAMTLATGQYMFTCDSSGSYALNIPLDSNGQFKLQVYADSFAPTIQTYDEFQIDNDVRMARAVECQ